MDSDVAAANPIGSIRGNRDRDVLWVGGHENHQICNQPAAGGWLDTRSLEWWHQQADDQTLLQVFCEPRKLRETIPETTPPEGGNGTAPQRQTAAGP